MTPLEEAMFWPEQEDMGFIYCQTYPEKKVWVDGWEEIDFTNFNFSDQSYAQNNQKRGNRVINGIALVLGQSIHGDCYNGALDFDGLDAVVAWYGSWENVVKRAQETRIEYHQDDKGHIHEFFKSKTPLGDGKHQVIKGIGNAKIEIRIGRELLFAWPSVHPDGEEFVPLGTKKIQYLTPGKKDELWAKCRDFAALYGSTINRRKYIRELKQKSGMQTGDGIHYGLRDMAVTYYLGLYGECAGFTDEQRKAELEKWATKQNRYNQNEIDGVWDWAVRTFESDKDRIRAEQEKSEREYKKKKQKEEERKGLYEEVCRKILQDNHIVTISETDEMLYYKGGVYVQGGLAVLKQKMFEMFGYDLELKEKREVKDFIMQQTYHSRTEFDRDLNVINLQNCLYNIETGMYTEHTPEYLSLNQKPIEYNESVGRHPSKFIKFLKEVVYPSDLWVMIELMAYTFYRDNPFEIITILHGSGSNGKSVEFGVLTALHGPENVSNVSLKTIIERPFGLYDLAGKACNLDAELSSGTIEDPAILKKITGRQRTRVEQKNQKSFDTILFAKLWLSANTVPQVGEDTDAYYRRNVIVGFPNKFEEKDYRCKVCDEPIVMGDEERADRSNGIYKLDPDLISKLTTPEELSALFNLLMYALRGILSNKRISVNEKSIEKRREKYEMSANPIQSFLNAAVEEDETASYLTLKDDAYRAFKRFCKLKKLAVGSKDKLAKALKSVYQEVRPKSSDKSKDRPRYWKGLKLSEEYQKWLLEHSEQQTLHEYADPERFA